MCISLTRRLAGLEKRTEKWLTQNGYRYEKGENQEGRLKYTIWKEGSCKVEQEIDPDERWQDIRKNITSNYEILSAVMSMKSRQAEDEKNYHTAEKDS